MSQPFIGEIRMFGGNFAPAGWAFCDGQLMPIAENDALFVLIGTTYGGDGQETFALPNLQSRVPIHMGQGSQLSSYQLGESGGVETVTLTAQQIPTHIHAVGVSDQAATQSAPANDRILATESVGNGQANTFGYRASDAANLVALAPQSMTSAGGSQPHENIQPYVTVSFIISLFGIFPTAN